MMNRSIFLSFTLASILTFSTPSPAQEFPTMAEITQLSAEKAGQVLPMRWEIFYDFAEQLPSAQHTHGPAPAVGTEIISDRSIPCIGQHPNLQPNTPLSRLAYPPVTLPELAPEEKPILHFFTILAPRSRMEEVPGADGVTFILEINSQKVFHYTHTNSGHAEWVIDLSAFRNNPIQLTLITDPRSNSLADWAHWGCPQILIEGRKAKVKEGPKSSRLAVSNLTHLPLPQRCLRTTSGDNHFSAVLVMDEHLDLTADLWRTQSGSSFQPVRQAPPLVVGEGADPQNHTLIRILNHWNLTEYQFLAYPPLVRGGVQVHTLQLPSANGELEPVILAAPLSAPDINELRFYSIHAANRGSFRVQRLDPPYRITIGNFLPDHPGDQIALISARSASNLLLIVDPSGKELKKITFPNDGPATLTLSTQTSPAGDTLLIYPQNSQSILVLDPRTGDTETLHVSDLTGGEFITSSASDPHQLWVSGSDPNQAKVQIIDASRQVTALDLGKRENRFYIQSYGNERNLTQNSQGKAPEHIILSRFEHLRMDIASPVFANPDFNNTDPEYWTGPAFRQRIQPHFDQYDTRIPAMWEPCFTHRQPAGAFDPWMKELDPDTGLPLYSMLNRNNKPADYNEFGTSHFQMSTYAFGLPALDSLYLYPLRTFLHSLAQSYHHNPEHLVGVEPNHEHEIAVEAEGTIGDYNLNMIAGFCEYLQRLYGSGMEPINQRFGTSFSEYFDAPRNWERGDWDSYQDNNPYFRNWIDYNRYVVNRRIAQTLREGLMAGFPPEMLKTHQIPDTYAIGNLGAFSDVVARHTPIDYILNTGTGYGLTHYGLWYVRPHNAIQGAHSSGFDQVSLGEYQALVPDPEQAWNQLRYMFDHGVYSVHCMSWPPEHDQGFNASMEAALIRLLQQDEPRPGMTRGVGQIRSRQDLRVAVLGTGAESTGLLKSVNEDGSFEGRVYVVPFHSHVAVETVAESKQLLLSSTPNLFGPYQALDSGEQFEICFEAQGKEGQTLDLSVLAGDEVLPGLTLQIPLQTGWTTNRVLFRIQLPVEQVTLSLSPPVTDIPPRLRNLVIYRQSEQTTKLTRGIFEGKRHQGGITFDFLPDDCGL